MQHTHTKRICKDFQTTTMSKCHDLYFQINTLLLTDVVNDLVIFVLIYKKIKSDFEKYLFPTMQFFQNHQENVKKTQKNTEISSL